MYKTGRCATFYFLGCLISFLVGCGGSGTEEDSSIQKPAEISSSSEHSNSNLSSAHSQENKSKVATSLSSSSSSSPAIAYERSRVSSSSSAAINKSTDITPPSSTTLFPHKYGVSTLTIIWDHATDNLGVSEYEIERDGKIIAIIEYPSFTYTDKGLPPNTAYTYTIRARDAAGNISQKSNELVARTTALTTATSSKSNSQDTASSKPQSSLSRVSSSIQKTSSSASSKSQTTSSAQSSSIRSNSSQSRSSQSSAGTSKANSSSSSGTSSARLRWEHPTARANGDYLELHEIGGYELRLKKSGSSKTTYFVIEGNDKTEYLVNDVKPGDVIDIAVFDNNGLYSEFVPIYPK